jgi:hypothetical protein
MNATAKPMNIAQALANAQRQLPTIAKDAVNTHLRSRYATLDGILDTVRDALAANGLCLTFRVSHDGDRMMIEAVLIHATGEEFSSGPIPCLYGEAKGVSLMQSLGSAMTYARRYATLAVQPKRQQPAGNSMTVGELLLADLGGHVGDQAKWLTLGHAVAAVLGQDGKEANQTTIDNIAACTDEAKIAGLRSKLAKLTESPF